MTASVRRRRFAWLLLIALVLLGAAGAASAAASVNNTYTIAASVRPLKSGTLLHPKPISTSLEWSVGTAPPGERPANVSWYAISYRGIDENTTLFVGCRPSRLSKARATVNSCPRGSEIGTGFLIFEIGATGFNSASYIPTCTASLVLFNGGHHDLTLFVYEGHPRPDQPAECSIPGRHVAIDVHILHSRRGISETFRVPTKLLHPAPGLDTTVVHAVIHVRAKTRVVGRRSSARSGRRRIGLFESFFCPPSHRRRVSITFKREDGGVQTRTALVRCKP
jgi:hypothetical protein